VGRSDTLACSSAALVATVVAYVLLGLVAREAVLNWVVGPLFPLVVLYVAPKVAAHVRTKLIR
jgi:hypothetical protein